eukprot:167575_1
MSRRKRMEAMRINWDKVDVVKSVNRNCCGCRMFVYVDETKIKFTSHMLYLRENAHRNVITFPVVLFEGSNKYQIQKAKKSIKSALNSVKKDQTKWKQGYAVFKHKRARKKRNLKLNKNIPSK